MATDKIKINRAPVPTLWAVVVAERLGYKHAEALTIARALTGLTAQSHGRALGIFQPSEKGKAKTKPQIGRTIMLQFLGRQIETVKTKQGVRAVSSGQPIKPESVERYLAGKFGDALPDARDAMENLARTLPPKELSASAYSLYGKFVPKVPAGTKGWGAKGELDLDLIRSLASKPK